MSQLIGGVAVPAFDAEVDRLIPPPDEWGSVEYQCALCNDAGAVYRIIVVEGLGNLVSLCEGLKRLGLVDVSMEPGRRKTKYDALFQPPIRSGDVAL